jgi:hypothetical protein
MATEPQQRAFWYIKDRDKPNLRWVADVLRYHGLDVYISGSAIMVAEYSDIDLLVCDPHFRSAGAVGGKAFEMSPRAQTAVDYILGQEGVALRKKEEEYRGGYAGSVICGYRWEFEFRGTRMDISYAMEPGGLTREKIAKLEAEVGGELGLEPEYERL